MLVNMSTHSNSELIAAYLDAVVRKDDSVVERFFAPDVEYMVNGAAVLDPDGVLPPVSADCHAALPWLGLHRGRGAAWLPQTKGVISVPARVLKSLGEQICDGLRKVQGTNDRTVEEHSAWKPFVPLCALGIDRNLIPLRSFMIAATRAWVRGIRFNRAAELVREQVIFVPVLRNS
jgi:hypothetical protein